MRKLLAIIFITTNICALGQNKGFANLENFTDWMVTYYKKPEPSRLFEAFTFGVKSEEIGGAQGLPKVIGFIASCLRYDTLRQQEFFLQLHRTTDKKLIQGFMTILWVINTDYSSEKLERFLNLEQIVVYKPEFERAKSDGEMKYFTDANLDIIWAEFYATGSEKVVEKVISKLNSPKSRVAGDARQSLIYNARYDESALAVCKKQKEIVDKDTKKVLDEIIKEASSKDR